MLEKFYMIVGVVVCWSLVTIAMARSVWWAFCRLVDVFRLTPTPNKEREEK